MKRIALLIGALAAFAVAAEAPKGYLQWTSSGMQAQEAKLIKGLAGKTSIAQELANFGTHSATMSHRLTSGEAELHGAVTDIFYIKSGGGVFVVGGKIGGGKETGPGEIRGTSIEGGTPKPMTAGDIVLIPAGTPHQIVLEKGETITYLVIKVRGK